MKKRSEKRRYYKLRELIFIASMFVVLFAFETLAVEPIDTGKVCSLTVNYVDGGVKLSGTEFCVFKVADVSADGVYTLSGKFSHYPVIINGLDSSGWRNAAKTLSGYAVLDSIPETAKGITDNDGNLEFANLKTGLYLLCGKKIIKGSYTYTPEDCLISLPNRLQSEEIWTYDVSVLPKKTSKYNGGGNSDSKGISFTVRKAWNDGGNEAARPGNITVALLKNQTVYDTVELNSACSWRYMWSNLDRNAEWSIAEIPVAGYTVSVERQGNTVILTNTAGSGEVMGASRLPQTGTPMLTGLLLILISALILCGSSLLKKKGSD